MKLKTRIIVGFVAVILVPLILFSASLYGFSQTQARHMQESSSQASDSDEMVYDISLAQSSSSQVRLMAVSPNPLSVFCGLRAIGWA